MHSLWTARSFHASPHLAVVGGGLVGLFAALQYQRRHPEHRVLVLEAGAFPDGASMRNAGFACFGSPSELLADMRAEGETAALARVQERWLGLRELRHELSDQAIGYDPCGGYELFREHDPLYTAVSEGFDRLNRLLEPLFGEAPFHPIDDPHGTLAFRGLSHATYTPFEGSVDSGALVHNLLRKAQEAGVLFQGSSRVVALDETSDGVQVHLHKGDRVLAGQVLLATNGYTRTLRPDLDVLPARGQVLLTAPLEGPLPQGTFHLDEGYYYFRVWNDRILLGGGRHLDKTGETTLEEGTTPIIQQALETLLREVILPDRPFTVERRWSGVMGFGSQGKEPLVERLGERLVAAVRLSGMGVAIGPRVALKAVELLG